MDNQDQDKTEQGQQIESKQEEKGDDQEKSSKDKSKANNSVKDADHSDAPKEEKRRGRKRKSDIVQPVAEKEVESTKRELRPRTRQGLRNLTQQIEDSSEKQTAEIKKRLPRATTNKRGPVKNKKAKNAKEEAKTENPAVGGDEISNTPVAAENAN